MLGNGTGGTLGEVIAAMLVHVYNFLFKPDDMTKIFTEFNKYIEGLFAADWFSKIYAVMMTIGLGLLVATYLIEMMDKVSQGDFSINVMFRCMLKYVLMYMVLLNILAIFNYLLDFTTAVFTDMNDSLSLSLDPAQRINQRCVANGINKYFGITVRIGMFILLAAPYIISVIFYVVLYFFAVSRLLEMVIRTAASPLVVGLSYFGHGANTDIVRYAKRTMGIFSQIVVILVISVMTTFTHNALITSDSGSTQGETVVANPANGLEVDGSYTEVGVTKTTTDTKKNDASGDEETTVTIGDTTWKPATSEDISTITTRAYTKKSLMNFVYYIMAPNHYVVSTGLMLAALLMVFKSRELSTRLFSSILNTAINSSCIFLCQKSSIFYFFLHIKHM